MAILRILHGPASAISAAGLASFLCVGAHGQTPADLAQAQARYTTEIARCNSGTLPAPAREACVRAAGAVLDRAQGTSPVPALATTPDGRATVMTPTPLATGAAASPASPLSEPIRTSTDGRATIVKPADGATGGTLPQ
ncbi:MAG: hypothetical protein H7346_26280 [Burkholderiaceae bacterium]|nr:hypothetical protein [Burkholderiaceae bacterium]